MKKYLMAAVSLICMTMTCVTFAACSSENDETANIIRYGANGSISAAGSNFSETFSGSLARTDYTTAIDSVVGGIYCTSSKDNEVIAACDKVYENHRTKHPSLKGSITITKYRGLNNDTGTVLKTYQYN